MSRKNTRWRRVVIRLAAALALLALAAGFVAWYKLFREVPQSFADDSAEHYFKYGSIGTENEEGVPYYLWLALPRIFPEHLPREPDGTIRGGGYVAFGVAWEEGQETPVGFSKKTIGFPRVGINCALCHATTFRTSSGAMPTVVPTGPSQRMDVQSYARFLAACASDPRFTAENLLAEIEAYIQLSWFDRLLYRYVIIPQTRKRLRQQGERMAWMDQHDRPRWGPGRIDPFNPVKFNQLEMDDDGTTGNSDMMPIWNMQARKGHLHWDGLNTDLTEVVLSGAIGDGATNKSLPIEQLARIESYLKVKQPPAYPFLDRVDLELAMDGQVIFQRLCAECHAPDGRRNGDVIPLSEIGTDPHRVAMWNSEAVERYHNYSRGYPWDFRHFVNMEGYVAVPLDGLWLRAPYLHNGSVPSLEDLLKPVSERPRRFLRGYDVLDPKVVGFIHDLDHAEARRQGYLYDTSERGNSSAGHEGPAFGTNLSPADKRALIEYLKTL